MAAQEGMAHGGMGDIDDLEARIAYLEARVGTNRGESAKDLPGRSRALAAKLESVLSDNQLSEFVQQYEQLAGLLMAGDVDEFLLSVEAKRTVLLSCESMVRQVAGLLEEVKQLEGYASVGADVDAIGAQLKPLKVLNLDNQRATQEFSARFELLLRSYNEFVSLTSHKFLHWDQIVSNLEH